MKKCYFLNIFLILFLFTNIAWGLDEQGACDLKMKTPDGTLGMQIQWQFVNNQLSLGLTKGSGANENVSATKVLLDSNTYLDGFSFNLQVTNNNTDKPLYLSVEKKYIKGWFSTPKPAVVASILTKAAGAQNKFELSGQYSIEQEDSATCNITYDKEFVKILPMIPYTGIISDAAYSQEPYKWDNLLVELGENIVKKENAIDIASTPRGVCFFDIDDTLSQDVQRDGNEAVTNACLKNGFLVGIITASNRDINEICDKTKTPFIGDTLCQTIKNNTRMYNSNKLRSGEAIPNRYQYLDNYTKSTSSPDLRITSIVAGFQKAYQAHYWRDKYYPFMDPECVMLFDDNMVVEEGYKLYSTNNIGSAKIPNAATLLYRPDTTEVKSIGPLKFGFFLTDYKKLDTQLSASNVARKVLSLIGDGCRIQSKANSDDGKH